MLKVTQKSASLSGSWALSPSLILSLTFVLLLNPFYPILFFGSKEVETLLKMLHQSSHYHLRSLTYCFKFGNLSPTLAVVCKEDVPSLFFVSWIIYCSYQKKKKKSNEIFQFGWTFSQKKKKKKQFGWTKINL